MNKVRGYGLTISTMSFLSAHGLSLEIAASNEVPPPNPSIYDVKFNALDLLKKAEVDNINELSEDDIYQGISKAVQNKLDALYGEQANERPADCFLVPYYDIGITNTVLTGDACLNATPLTIKGVVVVDGQTMAAANRVRADSQLGKYTTEDFILMAKVHIDYLDNMANGRYLSVSVKTNGLDNPLSTRLRLSNKEVVGKAVIEASRYGSAWRSTNAWADKDGTRTKIYGTVFLDRGIFADALNSAVVQMARNLISDINAFGEKVEIKIDASLLKDAMLNGKQSESLAQYLVAQVYHTFGFLMAVGSVSVGDDDQATVTVDMDSIPSNAWLIHNATVPMTQFIVKSRTDSIGGKDDFKLTTMAIIFKQVKGVKVLAVSKSEQDAKIIC